MKKSILIAMAVMVFGLTVNAQEEKKESKVQHLTYKEFLKKVWDFEKSPNTFVYKGKLPAIVDFYADWCGPCRRVAPIMEKLAEEYDGKLLIYKVNTQNESGLANAFQIRSIPTVLFIPMEGQPMMQVGALPEEGYRQVIEQQLLDKPKKQ
ncbi:MAG: thioredoxin [Bacteroidales bacterium]|nr:thioredoxin [Bacteroidales bacterium]